MYRIFREITILDNLPRVITHIKSYGRIRISAKVPGNVKMYSSDLCNTTLDKQSIIRIYWVHILCLCQGTIALMLFILFVWDNDM